ncbi:hypothetical protein IEQ34_020331 [Dendrobium chrysotoxum]|uniref:Uncharacterized protein n=1 Tax=Dendrobium chrysotoxum TaxID=161865 RepID=A0AAV7FKJ3_DENCH|nr:hypothetical protein IEQ34_020331 [Dendrobium chrysotoxum]
MEAASVSLDLFSRFHKVLFLIKDPHTYGETITSSRSCLWDDLQVRLVVGKLYSITRRSNILQKRTVCPGPSMGKSNNFMEPASLDTRRPKGKVVSPREAGIVQGIVGSDKRTATSVKSDASKMREATKESRGGEGLQFPNQIQFGVCECMHNIKACDASANSVHRCKSNIEREGYGFSVSEHGGIHLKSSVAVDSHASKVLQHGSCCHEETFNKESWKSPTVRNHGQNVCIDVVSNSDTHLIPSGQQKISHCSTKVGFLSSSANSSKENPSFEFFVVSEEGINLYVDLNSIPSEWITSLKDEVCIDQRLQHQSLGYLSNPGRFPDAGQHMKPSPSENSELNLQSNGVETNTGCTNSSLCSVVSENCQSEVYPLDATVASSGSFIVTGSNNPVETPGHLEITKGLSSHCIDYSNFGNSKIVDDIFSSQEQTLIHHDSIDASFRTVQINPSVRDVSTKSNADEIPCAGVTTANIETTECHSLNFQKTDDNLEVTTENNSALSVCEKNNPTEVDEMLDNSKITDIGIVEDQITVEHFKLERESRCTNIESSCHHGKPSDFSQTGNSLPEGPASIYENSRKSKSNLLKRKSKCSPFQNASDNKVSKRSRSSEVNEVNQKKRDDIVADNKNETSPPNLNSSVQETASDLAVLRRRSSRLLSKV